MGRRPRARVPLRQRSPSRRRGAETQPAGPPTGPDHLEESRLDGVVHAKTAEGDAAGLAVVHPPPVAGVSGNVVLEPRVADRQLASATPAPHQPGRQRVAVLGGAVMSAGGHVVADHRAYRLGAVPVDMPLLGSGLERQPVAARPALVPDPDARLPVDRRGATLAVGAGPAVDRVGDQRVDRSVPGPAPHGRAVGTLGRQVESVFQKPQQRLAGAAQFLDLVEDQRDRLLHPAVRVFLQTIDRTGFGVVTDVQRTC